MAVMWLPPAHVRSTLSTPVLFIVIGECVSPPAIHNDFLSLGDVQGEVVALPPLFQGSHLLPVGCLVAAGDQPHTCCPKIHNGVGDLCPHTVGV